MSTIEIFKHDEFTIHPDKAKFIPTQCITFLGFILNFIQMTITLNKKLWKQKKKITKKFLEKCSYNKISIETQNLVAAFPAVTLGSFYYRASETDKAKTL